MAFKRFALPDGTPVTVYKRKSSRSLRLTITPEGDAKVSIPRWAAYAAGVKFANSRLEWIKANRRLPASLKDGQRIGKAHRLRLSCRPDARKVTSRTGRTEIIVTYPPAMDATEPIVQETAHRAALRALRAEAETLLPQRLDALAARHGFTYNRVSIKRMKSRWGSCDRERNIVLNLFLMQLPWEQIDYVLLHELTHTEVLRHGPDFWQAMERVLPDVKQLREVVRAARPLVHDADQSMA
jgi:predicted metal-dependent hydrolase